MQEGFFGGWNNLTEYGEQLIHVALNLAFQAVVVEAFYLTMKCHAACGKFIYTSLFINVIFL